MPYQISEEQAVEIATLLILMAELSGDAFTVDQLKFQYTRASWCHDVAAAVLDMRDRRIDKLIANAITTRSYPKHALKLRLIEWDAERERFSPGPRAGNFMQKLDGLLEDAARNSSSSSPTVNVKRWVQGIEAHKRRYLSPMLVQVLSQSASSVKRQHGDGSRHDR